MPCANFFLILGFLNNCNCIFNAYILFLSYFMVVYLIEKTCRHLHYNCRYIHYDCHCLVLSCSCQLTRVFFKYKIYLSNETEKCYCASRRFYNSPTDARFCYCCSLIAELNKACDSEASMSDASIVACSIRGVERSVLL